MKYSVRTKLLITYLAVAIFTAVLIYLLIILTSDQRLKTLVLDQQLIEIQNEVKDWYTAEQNWTGFGEYFKRLHPPKGANPAQINASPHKQVLRKKGHGVVDANHRVLIRFLDFQQGEVVSSAYLSKALPVKVNNQTVAWVVPDDAMGISLQSEKKVFFDHINQVLLIAIVIAIGAAFIIAIFLAKVILRPIEALTKASDAMAKGNLEQKITVSSQDEIGTLAEAFNKMSEDLALADQQRRQMTADIAHDLGTPLQVISGYIEMVQDSSLALTPNRIDIIATELGHIKCLLDDLSLLAKADEQNLSLQIGPTQIHLLLERVARLYKQACKQKNITVTVDASPSLPLISLDEERMMQVLGNLISNALRYTPSGGAVSLMANKKGDQLAIIVKDSGKGIAKDDLPFVFDRFYRANTARSGSSGKMGLGLAISRALVTLQHGSIKAESPGIGNGATFTISFPLHQ